MRLILLLFAFGAFALSLAQQVQSPSLFNTVRPQVFVVVRKHPTGSEVVQVTMLDAKYPTDLLKQQAGAIAAQLGQPAQGLVVFRDQLSKDDPSLTAVRAQFGVKGLSEPATGTYRLEPIARAFAGAGDPNTITGIMVQFESMLPGTNTLRRYENDNVAVELSPQSGQIGVEYRILLKSQDPAKITIPEGRPKQEKPIDKSKPKAGIDWVFVVFGLIGALAIGALVYSFLLRARPAKGQTHR